ncbi:MAG: acetate--CoA ligase family protein [Desulfobacter sp.]|nr:MAG: acetate--CoA ligase family protein [Desulfobacter sp.]
MQLFIDFEEMTRVFAQAAGQDRFQLFEHETYELLSALGSESVPEYLLFARNHRLNSDVLVPFFGEKVVLKVVSPDVVHKSDVGGVKVVPKMAGKVRSESRRMVDTVSERFARVVEANPDADLPHYRGLSGRKLRDAVNRRIHGVLITQYLPPESDALGNELLVSLRWTREFGMVITAGLGGTDTELYAERFRLGQAVISASTAHVSGEAFFDLFAKTIAYEKLSGQTRGGERLVSDEQLVECFGAFIAVGNYFSPMNPKAPYVIEELEVNPFALVDYEMVPLDGLCKFSLPFRPPAARGIDRIGSLLHPQTLAIIGVSATKMNFGRNILKNLIRAGYDRKNITIVSPSAKEIDGVACVEEIGHLGGVDLLVVAVGAAQVPFLIDEIIDNNLARSVILIPGGMGETEDSRERAHAVTAKIRMAHGRKGGGPVFLGGNCLGMISRSGGLDTFFTPDACAPKRMDRPAAPVALISQSGAFALVRMASLAAGDPAYNITVGNQMDLTIGDFITYMADVDDAGIIAVYAEGFQDLDGLHACTGILKAVRRGKEVLVYKAGRTPEGKKATSGHTASVAGDYMVCTSCLSQAGALVTDSLEEFDGLVNMAAYLHGKAITGFRVGAMSPAGFETVGIADSLESRDCCLELPPFEPVTRDAVADLFDLAGLAEIMDIKNPLDLTPAAPDGVYTGIISAMAADDAIDAVVTSLGSLAPATSDTPAPDAEDGFTSGPESLSAILPGIVQNTSKPVVVFNDAGRAHEGLNRRLRDKGIPVFRSCSRAMGLLARYTAYRLRLENIRKTGGE